MRRTISAEPWMAPDLAGFTYADERTDYDIV